ncbi:MAG: GMC family oxidoreductase [Bdellovibrionaceae bacterium]|nr:GMC family oxidoreductase [Pseudobdellovibrionaceae bacterium]NUM57459.1 GMC family oxidoreductase [Pseudobdellovibrionaceae bacterium]
MNLHEITNYHWDYIILGTGMGGGTIGHALAKTGKSILYLEAGCSLADMLNATKGKFPDELLRSFDVLDSNDQEVLKKAGRYHEYIIDKSKVLAHQFIPLLGTGVGGSSLLYGAALERFFPDDFRATRYFGNLVGSSTVDWPFGYEELKSYYEQAERMYRVVGQADPLRPIYQNSSFINSDLSVFGKKIFDNWQSKGLHPYRLPIGHKLLPEAKCSCCQAFVCEFEEKSTSANCGVDDSLKFPKVKILTETRVINFSATPSLVTEVNCLYKKSTPISIKGSIFILATGAIQSPAILLRSKNEFWPLGLANKSTQVGKNFSRHFMDLCMVEMDLPKKHNFLKELALNDFYFYDGDKLGTIQSLGNPPSIATTLFEMYHQYYLSNYCLDKAFYLLAKNFGQWKIKSVFENNLCMAMIMDDVSYPDNYVSLSADQKQIEIRYRLRDEAKQRLKKFRNLALKSFNPFRAKIYPQAENNQRLAHASGTCRMGNDPLISVVDKNNKAHGIDNLYIVDASFFPSGSGINPALTIAANALRVAAHLEPTLIST